MKLIKSAFFKEKETRQALSRFVKRAKFFSFGKECFKFEEKFAIWQGRKYASMFNSGSSANLALIQALINLKRLKAGDKVAFSALTWSTNVMPLITLNLDPIPIDVEKNTLNLSSSAIEAAYKKDKFKCLFLTNVLGFSGDMDAIKKFCKKNNIILIEDNCESMGSEYKGKKLGNFGLASTFSFFIGHHMSTIEGGMVCTDDKELDHMLKIVRAHGWDRHVSKTEQNKLRKKHKVDDFYGKYTFYDIGYNLRPTEIQGFLGSNQLKHANKIVSARVKNYEKLQTIFDNDHFEKIDTVGLTKVSNFAFPLMCKSKAHAKMYIARANEAGIEIRPIIAGCITDQVFFKKYVSKKYHLPNARKVHECGFYFGNNPDLTEREIKLVLKTFSKND